jgi:luciferase-like monooxygenase
VKFGIALGAMNPVGFVDATIEAERLGYESVWLPEHLVFPVEMSRSPHPGENVPPVPPTTPIFDCFAYLSYLAGRTERVRLGTHVYNLGLRHVFVAARAIQTLDIVSGGRAEIGVGASWLEEEWIATGLDFPSRGRRLDEAIAVCKRLWTEPEIEHHGEFFDFAHRRREWRRAAPCRAPCRRVDRHVAHARERIRADRPAQRAPERIRAGRRAVPDLPGRTRAVARRREALGGPRRDASRHLAVAALQGGPRRHEKLRRPRRPWGLTADG